MSTKPTTPPQPLYYCPQCGRDVKPSEVVTPTKAQVELGAVPTHIYCANQVIPKSPTNTTSDHFNSGFTELLRQQKETLKEQSESLSVDATQQMVRFIHETLDGRRPGKPVSNIQILNEICVDWATDATMTAENVEKFASAKATIKGLTKLLESTTLLLEMFKTRVPLPSALCTVCHVPLEPLDSVYLTCPRCHTNVPKGLATP